MYAIYGNMDPINIPPLLAYIPYMDPMGYKRCQSIFPTGELRHWNHENDPKKPCKAVPLRYATAVSFFYPRDGAKGPTSHGTAPTLTANATNGSPVVLANPDANHGAGIFTYMTG